MNRVKETQDQTAKITHSIQLQKVPKMKNEKKKKSWKNVHNIEKIKSLKMTYDKIGREIITSY